MNENDYIAEYVKERHPGILGFDFCIWKAAKVCINWGNKLSQALQNLDPDELPYSNEGEDKNG